MALTSSSWDLQVLLQGMSALDELCTLSNQSFTCTAA